MTFLGEIIEHYLQMGNFLGNLMSILNKETKNKTSMLKIKLVTTEQSVLQLKRITKLVALWR